MTAGHAQVGHAQVGHAQVGHAQVGHAQGGHAQADRHAGSSTLVPYSFVPWLQQQGFMADEDADRAEQQQVRRRLMRTGRERSENQEGLILSPAETRALLDALEEADKAAPPSALEKEYSRRIVEELSQFGYGMFAPPSSEVAGRSAAGVMWPGRVSGAGRQGVPAGAVQDDFVLGSGDRLEVIIRGQLKLHETYTVDENGRLIIDEFPPVMAAGRTIGQVREVLESHADSLHNTDIYLSLDAVQQIDVLIVGHVNTPGRHTLTVFHTVLDALMAADGIEKTGSLRQVKLVRDGRSKRIDLYGLLVHGSAHMDLNLRDGDRLIIPPIGPTVAVAGGVKRPGIYELRTELNGMLHHSRKAAEAISLEEMLTFGGGVLSPGQNRFLKLGLTGGGQETVVDVSHPTKPVFTDGSILKVAPSRETRAGTVELTGHTTRDGLHDLDRVPTLARLLASPQTLKADGYPLIAILERRDREQMARHYIAFAPLMVFQGHYDRKMQDGDVVHLFSRADILTLPSTDNKADNKNDTDRLPGNLNNLQPAVGSHPGHDSAGLPDPVLVDFLRERMAFVRGAVRQPGGYPVTDGVTLENIVAAAGGLTLEANTRNIEITSALQGEGHQTHGRSGTRRIRVDYTETDPATVMLAPGDTVRVNQRFKKIKDKSVQILGEVQHPGRYDLVPGERLSDLLARAGGLTREAYPDGAIFSRASARRAEESRFRTAARDLQRAIALALEDDEKSPSPHQVAMARDLVEDLDEIEAVGRITVEADPAVLSVNPDFDILLESGDRIFIPKRPLTVRVNGEVLSPAHLQFRKDKTPRDYIAEAGGPTFHADTRRTFVMYPDGSAEPLQVNTWNHNPVFIPPGSTIVVPRDPEPYTFIETARDLSQIFSNLAITGIFIDDLRE